MPDAVFPHVEETCKHFNINTPSRLAAFIATLCHESGEFKYVKELASGEAYEGRASLGNTQSGDGVRFKGRGFIQLTGRYNYTKFGEAVGIDCINHPELLESYKYAALSAGWFWDTHNLNTPADVGDFRRVTKIVNGGYNGWENRLRYYNKAIEVFGATEVTPIAIEEKKVPFPAMLAALFPLLLDKIPALLKIFTDKEKPVSERNVDAALKVVEIVKEATGTTSIAEAVEQVVQNQEACQAASKAIEEQWFELTEVGGGGIAGARAAAIEYAKQPRNWPLELVTYMFVTIFGAAILFVLAKAEFTAEHVTMSLQAALGLALMVGGFWLGSSYTTSRRGLNSQPKE